MTVDVNSILLEILANLNHILPARDISRARDYVMHNESGVALEHICFQLCEYESKIPKKIFDKIEFVATLMGIDATYTEGLELE